MNKKLLIIILLSSLLLGCVTGCKKTNTTIPSIGDHINYRTMVGDSISVYLKKIVYTTGPDVLYFNITKVYDTHYNIRFKDSNTLRKGVADVINGHITLDYDNYRAWDTLNLDYHRTDTYYRY